MSLPPLIQSMQLHMESGSSSRRRGLSTCPADVSAGLQIGCEPFEQTKMPHSKWYASRARRSVVVYPWDEVLRRTRHYHPIDKQR